MRAPTLEPFLAALAPCLRNRLNHRELERLLHARWSVARTKWPSLRVPGEVIAAFLGERVPTDAQSAAVLACMPFEELLLTCACARGDSSAIRILQDEYLPPAQAALARLGLDPHDVDEVTQVLLERLLLGKRGRPPRILAYRGRGDLASWLRVCAIRGAYRHLRKERSHAEATAEDMLPDHEVDLEAGYSRQSCRMLLSQSLDEAAWTLTPHEKRFLQAHYLDGLTLAETGMLHGVHRATAARRLAETRRKLRDRTFEALMKRLNAQHAEVASVIQTAVASGAAWHVPGDLHPHAERRH